MESDSSSDVARHAQEKFEDPVIIVHPERWEDWTDQEVDVFLDSDADLNRVVIAERDVWIRILVGENNG